MPHAQPSSGRLQPPGPRPERDPVPSRNRALVLGPLILAAAAGVALAVALGQVDDFEDGTVMGWAEDAASTTPPANVADGGPEGTGDNYLENEASGVAGPSGRMEMFNGSQWVGDYLAAGVGKLAARLANLGSGDGDPSDDPDLFIRLAVEGGDNSSRYGSLEAARLPADGEWRFAIFDLAEMGLIAGVDSLDNVLANVTELRILSAQAGPAWTGDTVDAKLGVDDLGGSGLAATDRGSQPGLSHAMVGPDSCRGCHGNYDFANDLEPWNSWAGSMMAQATRDPIFWAALDVANNDLPGAGDFCLRCHTPAGWLGGRSEPLVDGCELEGTLDDTGDDFDGITCHTCHRMMVNPSPPAGEQAVYTENARFWLDDSDCGGDGEPCRRGPYDYDAGDGFPPSHAWAFSAYHEASDICGNCHNVTNPVKNLIDGGVDTGLKFPIERTFSEWQQSDYGTPGPAFQTCQGCHMVDATADPAYACVFETNNHSGDLPVHELAGGNAWVPDVIAGEYPNLGLTEELAASRDRALDMLQNRSATIELTVPTEASGGLLGVEVKITNTSGHKLPSGYSEGRRMWIHVEARDGAGALIWETGAYDAGTGVLTLDPQVKVYEVKQGIWNHNGTGQCDAADAMGKPIFHFVLNDCIALDNRIPPLGFTGGGDPETQPVGYVYPETSPGSGVLVNYDVTDYSIPIPGGTVGPVTVTAALRYQTASKEYVDFLLAESDEHGFPLDCIPRNASPGTQGRTRGEYLADVWNSYGRSPPVEMVTASAISVCFPLTVGHTGPGADPLVQPAASAGCTAGSYVPGELIQLTAVPDDGWAVDEWSGTDDDFSTALGNTLTMPATARAVSVDYAIPQDLVLTNLTVDTARLFQACNTITTDPGFQVTGPGGAATLRAGTGITHESGFSVVSSGAYAAVIEPGICD